MIGRSPHHPRSIWPVVALLLVLAAVAPFAAGTASAASDIAITNVTVSTEQPAPGVAGGARAARGGAARVTTDRFPPLPWRLRP